MAGAPAGTVAEMTDGERIREVYRSYEEQGRDRLWDLRNRGFARLSRDRDLRLRDLLARSLPGGSASLLDVGCGNGSLLASVGQRWPDVRLAGLDLQPERIEEARANAPDAQLVVGSADALPFEDRAFDVVSAITLMSSLPTDRLESDTAERSRA